MRGGSNATKNGTPSIPGTTDPTNACSYFSVLRNSSKLCGSTSGTTCTRVVNL
jgi:hypothetical protein